MNTQLASLLNRAADDLRDGWARLVAIAMRMQPADSLDDVVKSIAKRGHCGEESVRRKLLSIQYVSNHLGYTEEQILSAGQEVILSKCQKERRSEQQEQAVWLKWKVSGAQRDAIQREFTRIAQVLDLSSSEQVWEFVLSQLRSSTEEELRHAAGEGRKQ